MNGDEIPAQEPTREQREQTKKRERRQVIAIFSMGGVAAVAAGIPVAAALLAPAIVPDQTAWRDVGAVDDFTVGQTVEVKYEVAARRAGDGVSSTAGAWTRRIDQERFVTFQMNCMHLGCPVHWVSTSGLFLCPCHGGVYDYEGRNAAGPPRVPLRRQPTRVVNGRVQVLAQPIPIPTIQPDARSYGPLAPVQK